MRARSSGMPLVTGEKGTNVALVCRAIILARVVLPEPGGPQRMSDERVSDSIARRSGRPGATISSWPRKSVKSCGLMRSAKGTNESGLSSFDRKRSGSCSRSSYIVRASPRLRLIVYGIKERPQTRLCAERALQPALDDLLHAVIGRGKNLLEKGRHERADWRNQSGLQ